MSIISASTSAQITIAAGRTLNVSTEGEAAVDILSGVIGASQDTRRLVAGSSGRGGSMNFGPYGLPVLVNVRGISGDTITTDVLDSQTIRATVDPVTGAATGGLLSGPAAVPFVLSVRGALLAALMGDSLMNENGPNTVGNTIFAPDTGWFNWFNAAMDNAFDLVLNAGIFGRTTQQIYDLELAQVIASSAQVVIVMTGTNDAVNSLPYSDTIKWKRRIYDALRQAGKIVIIRSAFPLAKLGAAAGNLLLKYADFDRRYARKNSNTLFYDSHRGLVDPLSTSAYAKANNLRNDFTHLSPRGARADGFGMAAVFKSVFPSAAYHVSSVIDTRVTDPTARNILPNSLGQGTPVTTGLAAGVTGAWLPNFQAFAATGAPTVLGSVVARADGFGNDQVMDITFTAAGQSLTFRTNDSSYNRCVPGESMISEAFIGMSSASGVYHWQFRQNFTIDGVVKDSIMHSSSGDAGSTTQFDQSDMASMPFLTPEIVLGTSASVITAFAQGITISSSGAGTVRFTYGRCHTSSNS